MKRNRIKTKFPLNEPTATKKKYTHQRPEQPVAKYWHEYKHEHDTFVHAQSQIGQAIELNRISSYFDVSPR